MVDIATLSNGLVGAIAPFLTQVIRDRWLKVDGLKAHCLSVGVAGACVLLATWVNQGPWDLTAIIADVGLAQTLSQVVYQGLLKTSDNARALKDEIVNPRDAAVVVAPVKDTPDP